jgi:hypothetical protein
LGFKLSLSDDDFLKSESEEKFEGMESLLVFSGLFAIFVSYALPKGTRRAGLNVGSISFKLYISVLLLGLGVS